jgi:ankyrin repeat protein
MFVSILKMLGKEASEYSRFAYKEIEVNEYKKLAASILIDKAEGVQVPAQKDRLVSYLSPQIREASRNNPSNIEKISKLISEIWPLPNACMKMIRNFAKEDQAATLDELHLNRSIYMLHEMRERLGSGYFESLLRERFFSDGESDLNAFIRSHREFFECLAESGETELLSIYLTILFEKKQDTGESLNRSSPRFFAILAESNCSSLILALGASLTNEEKKAVILDHPHKNTLLHTVVCQGNLGTVQAVLSLCDGDVKEAILDANQEGDTPLHLSAGNSEHAVAIMVWKLYQNNEQRMKALQPNEQGDTPLHLFARNNSCRAFCEIWSFEDYNTLMLVQNKHGYTPLQEAISKGCSDMGELLYDVCPRPLFNKMRDMPNTNEVTLLHLAVLAKSVFFIKRVCELYNLTCPRNAFSTDKSGNTPLHIAALLGNLEVYQAVTKQTEGIVTDRRFLKINADGDTIVHLAVKGGNRQILRHACKFFEHNAVYKQAFLPNLKGETPLDCAIRRTDPVITSFIVDYTIGFMGPLIKEKYPSWKTVISLEQKIALLPSLDPQEICTLLENNTFTEPQIRQATLVRNGGWMPFYLVARLGDANAVKAFWSLYRTNEAKEQALDFDAKGLTPLYGAIKSGNVDTVLAVLELYPVGPFRKKVLELNTSGKTPLSVAALNGEVKVLQKLMEIYENENLILEALKTDVYGSHLIHCAVLSGNQEAVQMVAAFNQKHNRPELCSQADDKGNSPLHTAASKGRLEIFIILLELVSAEEKKSLFENGSLFHCAIQGGNLHLIERVWALAPTSEHHEKWLAPNEQGITPFHSAAQQGDPKVAQLVWDCYPLDMKDIALKPSKEGETPFSRIVKHQNRELIVMIEKSYSFQKLLEWKVLYKVQSDVLETLIQDEETPEDKRIMANSVLLLRKADKSEFFALWVDLFKKEDVQNLILPDIFTYDFEITYILVAASIIADEFIKRFLNSNRELPQHQKLIFLPFYEPAVIRSIISDIAVEQKNAWKETKISLYDTQLTAKEGLSKLRNDWAGNVNWEAISEDTESEDAYITLTDNLKTYPIWTLAALAEEASSAHDLVCCYPALSEQQRAVVVPLLNDKIFLRDLSYWDKYTHRMEILSNATVEQKNVFIDYFEKSWVNFSVDEVKKRSSTLLKNNELQSEEILGEILSLEMQIAENKLILTKLKHIFPRNVFQGSQERWENELQAHNHLLKELEIMKTKSLCVEDAPEEYLCPITGDLMDNPVTLPSGKICDQSVIEKMQEEASSSNGKLFDPFSRQPISMGDLLPNTELKSKIQNWKSQPITHKRKSEPISELTSKRQKK